MKHKLALEVQGKASELLERLLAERRGHEAAAAIDATFAELVPLLGTRAACRGVGRSRATHYRGQLPAKVGPVRPRPAPPNALTAAEQERVLEVLRSKRFVDLSPAHVWAILLDEAATWPACP